MGWNNGGCFGNRKHCLRASAGSADSRRRAAGRPGGVEVPHGGLPRGREPRDLRRDLQPDDLRREFPGAAGRGVGGERGYGIWRGGGGGGGRGGPGGGGGGGGNGGV